MSSLYYALVYPFLSLILQKKAIRLMTFSIFDEHTSLLFKKLNIIKLQELVSYHIAVFIYRFKNRLLPPVFDTFFSKVSDIYQIKRI